MKTISLLLAIFFTAVVAASDECGIKKSPNWPWMLSLFYDTSNLVMCQGNIISDRHVLTAGHCLQQKHLLSVRIYPGLLFYRPHDNANGTFPWQLEHINFHPDMKLASHGRFINGGFVASMEIRADLAIGTLKRAIQFSDKISPVCLPAEDYEQLIGSYSGWDKNNESSVNFNATIDKIEGEIFKLPQESRSVKIIEGTGIYTFNNSSWTIIGFMTMMDYNLNNTESIQFINIHMFANWITNVLQKSSDALKMKQKFDDNEEATLKSSKNGSLAAIDSTSTSISPSKVAGNASSLARLNNRMLSTEQSNNSNSNLITNTMSTATARTVDNSRVKNAESSTTQAANSIAMTISPTSTERNVIEKTTTGKTLSEATNSITTLSSAVTPALGNIDSITTMRIESNTSSGSKINDDNESNARNSINGSSTDENSNSLTASTITTLAIGSSSSSNANLITTKSSISNPIHTTASPLIKTSTASQVANVSAIASHKTSTEISSAVNSTSGKNSIKTTTEAHAVSNATESNESAAIKTTLSTVAATESSFLPVTMRGSDLLTTRSTVNAANLSSIILNNSIATATATVKGSKDSIKMSVTSPLANATMSSSTTISQSNDDLTTVASMIKSSNTQKAITTKSSKKSTDSSMPSSSTESSNKPPVSEIIPSTIFVANKLSEKLSSPTTELPQVKLPQGRNLKGFENVSISNTLPNATQLPQNITQNTQNMTMEEEEQPLLASYGLDAPVIISIVFLASVFILFIIFCVLGRQKPTTEAH